MTWHVHLELLEEYERGALEPSRMMAVDAHLQGCAECRSTVKADPFWLDAGWTAIYDAVHAPEPSPAGRLLHRAGLPDHRVRLLAATPALRWSWLAATAAVLACAVAAAYSGVSGAFLILAPVLPVLAVATAYGPPVDPMHEITAATPAAGPALLLWRATVVVGVSIAMSAVAATLLPGPGWDAVAWLLPALLLCVGSLALATAVALPLAAGLLGGAWLGGVALVAVAARPGAVQALVFGLPAQSFYLIAAVGAGAVLTAYRRRLDPVESR